MHLPIASCNSYDSFVLSNLPRASIAPWLHAARLPFRKYNIPNIQVCGLMGRFWTVLFLVVSIYNIQIPAIRMKYHPSVIWQLVHILFLSILTYMHLGVRTLCSRHTITWYINTLLEPDDKVDVGFVKTENLPRI